MEPDNINPNTDTKKDAADLHAEGIDLVGSSVALDNEFSTPEEAYAKGETPEVQTVQNVEVPTEKIPEEAPAPKIPNGPVQSPTPIQKQQTEEPLSAPLIQNDPSIHPLRTFKSDAEEAVRYGNASKVTIALAEQKKREASSKIEYTKEKHSSPGLYIALVLILILALGGGWYYWFISSQPKQEKVVTPTVTFKSYVAYTKASTLVLDSGSNALTLIAAKLGASTGPLGTVTALVPISNTGATSIAPLSSVVSGTHIPDRLLRSLSDDYMIGSYTYDVQSPFIVLKNTFFQNAFSGMLAWEKDMREDLLPLIQVSSPDTLEQDATSTSFEDGVLSNIDIRSLKDASGKTILVYAFADNDTIVITTTINSLKYLLDRILQVRTIQ